MPRDSNTGEAAFDGAARAIPRAAAAARGVTAPEPTEPWQTAPPVAGQHRELVLQAMETGAIGEATCLYSGHRGGIAEACAPTDRRNHRMTENVTILLAVLVAANILLLLVVIVRSWTQRRRSRRSDALDAITSSPLTRPSAGPRPNTVAASDDVFTAMPANRTDRLTETLLHGEWNRILADEDARIRRYRRPATIVLIELDGFEEFVSALGQSAGDRVLVAVADTLKRHARSSDHVARLGPGRFGLLLPETGEVEAINLTERMRSLCELWLASGSIALRLAIGWASPAADAGLAESYVVAAERMYSELRRGARRATVGSAANTDHAPRTELEGSPSPSAA